MSLLFMITFPLSDLRYPVITLIEVVLPAPLGPRNPITSPTLTSKESLFMAVKSPKFFEISITLNIFSYYLV